MSMKPITHLMTKTKKHYDNILIVDPEENPISTIDQSRLNFYKKNDLVERIDDIEGYSSVHRLKFYPNIEKEVQEVHYLPIPNRCVITGEEYDLTLHHVVPYCIRKHLPLKYKGRSKEWCVLLTNDTHIMVEEEVLKLYQEDRELFAKGKVDYKLKRRVEILNMVERGYWDKIPDVKQIKLLMEADIYSLDEITHQSFEELKGELYVSRERIYREWVYDFIKRKGGIRKIYDLFGEHFKETFRPKYLPNGFLEWNFDK